MNAPVDPASFDARLSTLSGPNLAFIRHQLEWVETARLSQLPPDPEDQAEWLEAMGKNAECFDPSVPWNEFGAMAGRGFGKTRVGAEWTGRVAYEDLDANPWHVVAPTQADVRLTCFEGPAGLLKVIPPECVVEYNRGDIVIKLVNGAMIRGFSAEKADRLRGPQCAGAWCDEIAAWGANAEETLDMLEFGLRLGAFPRLLWTSTPRPNTVTRRLTKPQAGRIIARGSTYDNKANLADKFLEKVSQYEGTKLGRQELHGEMLNPEEAGIVRRSWLNIWPADKPLPKLEFIIMSLDTAFTEKTRSKTADSASDTMKGDPDPTACGVWGVFHIKKQTHVILLDCWEDHLGLPDLVRKVKKEKECRYGDDQDVAIIRPLVGSAKPLSSGRKPDMILIEDKGSGISLRQTLAEADIECWAYNPGRADKLARLHIVSPVFAQRRVWIPESRKTPGKPVTWAEGLITQLCTFAGEGSIKHDDQVDQTTQAFRILMDKGLLVTVKSETQRSVGEPAPPPEPVQNPYAA